MKLDCGSDKLHILQLITFGSDLSKRGFNVESSLLALDSEKLESEANNEYNEVDGESGGGSGGVSDDNLVLMMGIGLGLILKKRSPKEHAELIGS